MKKTTRVQIIGHGLSDLSTFLRQHKIYTECIIPSCNPLAMAGKTDPAYLKYSDDPNASLPTLLNIRKNLSQLLSHDPENFCTNYNTLPYGAEVRDRNTSEYIIIMNSAITFPLYEKNGIVYSHAWSGDKFIAAVSSDKSYVTRRLALDENFNWKNYYDKFIDAVMKEYDKDHIILIKLNASQWFMNDRKICFFDKDSATYRNLADEFDDYFAKQTCCAVVDEMYNHIPNIYVKNAFPYIIQSKKTTQDIAAAVAKIINGGVDQQNNFAGYEPTNKLAMMLSKKCTRKIIDNNEENLHIIINKNLSINDIETGKLTFENTFSSDIVRLKCFLDHHNIRTLSEYALGLMAEPTREETDYELIELYTKYFKLNINDIIAFYMIYTHCGNKAALKSAAQNILNNPDCLPVTKAKKICAENIKLLGEYPYINSEFKGVNESSKVFVGIENNCYFVFDLDSDEFLTKVDFPLQTEFDYMSIINNAYNCPVKFADALTYSYEYYAEKARRGDGSTPTYLNFKDKFEFYESLMYIEYKPLLENEKFVFEIEGDSTADLRDFKPIVDFTEIVDPNTALINIRNGLGDQICHYIMGEMIAQNTNRKVIYFDLPVMKSIGLNNGSDFKRIIKHPARAFSDVVSPRLTQLYNPNNDSAISLLRRINDLNLVVNTGYYNHSVIKNELKLTSISGSFICDDIRLFLNTALPYSYYFNLIRIEETRSIFDYNLSDYIEFPPFEEQSDIDLSNKMLSCDAVVVHIRRGDRVALGWGEDISFFVEAIGKTRELTQYENKKYFVFSDDIKWCREHQNEIGLDSVGDCEVIFVDGHKGEECFRDVQLMSLGKILMCGNSGFPRIAAMYSDKWEMFFCAVKQTDDFFHKYVRKNKYETSPFLRTDYSH